MTPVSSATDIVDVPVSDLGPLAWVFDELRKSIDAAGKALKRFSLESRQARESDLGAADPAPLRIARSQLHQAVGALDMVGFIGPAAVVRAMEAAVQRFLSKPGTCNDESIGKVERAGFALVEYLEAVLNGKTVHPVALFAQYRDVQELAGAQRVHPADLWEAPARVQSVGFPGGLMPSALKPGPEVRAQFDRYLLHVIKSQHPVAAEKLKETSAGLVSHWADRPAVAQFWMLAAAYFEGVQLKLLPADVYTKRAASRVLLQYSTLAQGKADISAPLVHDLLFFVSQAQLRAGVDAPWLVAVRAAWGLSDAQPIDYEKATLGRFDPALLAQARKRINAAKESWSLLSGGDSGKLKQVTDQFALVGDSLQKVFPHASRLVKALLVATDTSRLDGGVPSAELGMEVATAVLYLEAVLQDMEPNDPTLNERLDKLAQRVASAHAGQPSLPLEAWMEELYRRVSDRHTMGSVVGELKVSLGELERSLDGFFRNPAEKTALVPVPQQLAQMRGVLSVLGLQHATQAVSRMREKVEELLVDEIDPQRAQEAGTFGHLANNLSALSFLIDMLNYQPALARKLFVFDADLGELKPLMGRVAPPAPPELVAPGAAVEQAVQDVVQEVVASPAEAMDLADLTMKLDHLAEEAALADQQGVAAAARDAANVVATQGAESGAKALAELVSLAVPEPEPEDEDEDDLVVEDDLLDIFLEEARDVIQAGRAALQSLRSDPASSTDLTTLRRAFHTLKGSSRMVGLQEFGEASWALEQVLNTWLADGKPADDRLQNLSLDALGHMARWVDDIAGHADGAWQADPFRISAEALRQRGEYLPIALDVSAAPVEPSASDVDVDVDVELVAEEMQVAGDTQPADLVVADLEMPQVLEDEPLHAVDFSDTVPGFDADFELPLTPETAVASGLEAQELSDLDFDGLLTEPVPLDVPGQADATAAAEDATELPLPVLVEDLSEPVADLQLDFDVPGGAEAPATVDAALPPALETDDGADGVLAALDEDVKVIGPLRIGVRLFNVFLNEADEWSRRLSHDLAEWQLEYESPLPDTAAALAHSIAGSSGAVGFEALSELARALEHALDTCKSHCDSGYRAEAAEAALFNAAAEDIRRLLHQFAAGFLKEPHPEHLQALRDYIHRPLQQEELPGLDFAVEFPAQEAPALEESPTLDAALQPLEPMPEPMPEPVSVAPVREAVRYLDDDIDAADTLDADLFQIFEEEALELLPQMGSALRQWVARPENQSARMEVLRALHTLKGSARLAGALRLGEMAHRMETQAERLGSEGLTPGDLEPLLTSYDGIVTRFDELRQPETVVVPHRVQTAAELPVAAEDPEMAPQGSEGLASPEVVRPLSEVAPAALPAPTVRQGASAAVRVRADLLDRLVNQTGEVMITRSRMEAELAQLKGSLGDLTGNLDRLRLQLRDIELQAESQMQSRLAQAKDHDTSFDPLEFDRFTRVQELTRMMAESVNDVATVQRTLQRAVEATEDGLIAQGRQTRELQRDLLRTRMVEFEGIADRLYRVVRQASKETGKQVRLDIEGGSIEMDRGVLDRMTPAFEHLLRNCVDHGIESPERRVGAGKTPEGQITVRLSQEGNDVSVVFEDDGAGLNLDRIRAKAHAQGLIEEGASLSDQDVAQLIFAPGLSTAAEVTGLSGRGIGMDVVRSEVISLGGRIETRSVSGQGAHFRMVLPLTTAVTQVVMLRAGAFSLGVPSGLVEVVRRSTQAELNAAYDSGVLQVAGEEVPFYWAGSLLQVSRRSEEAAGRTLPVVIFRSASQRIALHVDEVLGNQEVVVKNLGPQLSRLPGLAAMTVLASGAVVLIYNPVALSTVYGPQIRQWQNTDAGLFDDPSADQDGAPGAPAVVEPLVPHFNAAEAVPLVLVVDDSITVRRVTQRLLQREGYRVVLAADGLQALEKLQQERPAVVLSDIEMPRMDGFDLVRNIRSDPALAGLPVIMITSRIAEKHREHARELGVDHYLGKPYAEDELLGLIQHHCAEQRAAAASS